MTKCPICGADTQRIEHAQGGGGFVASGPWQQRDLKTYASGDAVPAGSQLERRQPARPPAVTDVKVTFLYSVGSLFVLFIAGLILAIITGELHVLIGFSIAGVVAFVAAWFLLLVQGQRLLWLVETITGRDLDHDSHTGKPPAIRKTVRIERRTPDGQHRDYHETYLEEYQCEAIADALFNNGLTFSRRNLCPDCFPSELYTQVRNNLVRGGYLVPTSSAANAALALTEDGVAFFEQFL